MGLVRSATQSKGFGSKNVELCCDTVNLSHTQANTFSIARFFLEQPDLSRCYHNLILNLFVYPCIIPLKKESTAGHCLFLAMTRISNDDTVSETLTLTIVLTTKIFIDCQIFVLCVSIRLITKF